MAAVPSTESDVALKVCEIESCQRISTTLCHHCNKNVCRRHFNEHADQLVQELNPLADFINKLGERITSFCLEEYKQTLLDKLTHWLDECIKSIHEFHDLKKNTLNRLFQDKEEVFAQRTPSHLKILETLKDYTTDLLKEEDVTFDQLKILKRRLSALEDDINKTHSWIGCDPKPLLLDNGLLPIYSRVNSFMAPGTLLSIDNQTKLNEFYGTPKQTWELIYKAARDGFSGQDFHHCSDNKGPTMTIIQSKNDHYLFGGYAEISWTRCGVYKCDPAAFLFTLTNPHGIEPTKFFQKSDGKRSIGHAKADGPCFGGLVDDQKKHFRDIWICTNANNSETSTSDFPVSYIDTTDKGETLFTGAKNFMVEEIEVYKRLDGDDHCDVLDYH